MGTKKCPYCGKENLVIEKKCKHCDELIEEILETESSSIQNMENIRIKKGDLNLWEKIALIYPLSKKCILDEFILVDGILTVTCKSGRTLQASLNECAVSFETDKNGLTWIIIKTKNNKIHFAKYPWTITEDEWEQIQTSLNPKETRLSKAGKILEKGNKVLNIVKKIIEWIT